VPKRIKRHLFISGRVQRVGYRAFIRKKAKNLCVKGWVKNLLNGRVEAVFWGTSEKVAEMIELVRKGPHFSQVEDVKILKEDIDKEIKEFKIIN